MGEGTGEGDPGSRAEDPGTVQRHLGRYRQIAEILVVHGLGFVIGEAGLQRWVPLHHGLLGHEARDQPYTSPEHLRLAFEQLGPAFVKLGQALSTRQDLLPPAYRDELARLQDDAPPVAGPDVAAVIERELGAPPGRAFAAFDPSPLASASLGQAHAATLADGTEVVVKVRRPGVVEQVELDLEILANLTARAVRQWDAAADYDLAGIAEEFSATLRAELDYLAEARSAERFRANFAHDPGVRIPRVHWDRTTSRVLTLERMRGLKVSDLDALDAAGIDRPALAASSARALAKMVFEDGFFHADPHPGNVFIEPDPQIPGGRISLIDFGMVGTVDRELRDGLAALLIALAGKDARRAARTLAGLSTGRTAPDVAGLGADLIPVMRMWGDRPLSEVPLGALIREVLGAVRGNHLQLPRELALLLRTIVMAEGVGAMLDPGFQLGPVLGPYARALAFERFTPPTVARRLARAGAELLDAAETLPRQLRSLEEALERAGPGSALRAGELGALGAHIDAAARRLAAAALAGALALGVGEIIASQPAPRSRALRAALVGAELAASVSLARYAVRRGRERRRA